LEKALRSGSQPVYAQTMKNPLANVNWFSPNLSLKILSIGLWLMVSVALFVPRFREFALGMAFSWSMILAFQIFQLKPVEEVDRDRDLVTTLNLK
jgi:hypothetical protein